jgi:hypothetical protein
MWGLCALETLAIDCLPSRIYITQAGKLWRSNGSTYSHSVDVTQGDNLRLGLKPISRLVL